MNAADSPIFVQAPQRFPQQRPTQCDARTRAKLLAVDLIRYLAGNSRTTVGRGQVAGKATVTSAETKRGRRLASPPSISPSRRTAYPGRIRGVTKNSSS